MRTLRFLACVSVLAVWLTPVRLSAQNPADAEALQAAGNWAGAESVWRTLAEQHPNDYRLWTSLGVSLAHQNRFSEAILAYRRALTINPHAPQTYFNLGLAYFRSGDFEKAVSPLMTAEKGLPPTQQIELLLGMSLYGANKYKEAVAHLELAEAANSNNRELKFVLAQAYLWAGEYDKAKSAFQTMLERDPDSPQVQMLVGEAYDGLGQTDNAIAAFRKAAAAQLPEAHFGLGYLLWKKHDYENAASEFRIELTNNPKNYKALAYLGDCELKSGDLSRSREHLLSSISIQDALWITHFDLGKMATDQREYSNAVKQFERAIELDPERPEAHYRLAQAYRQSGNEIAARRQLEIVSRLHEHKTDDMILKISGKTAGTPPVTKP